MKGNMLNFMLNNLILFVDSVLCCFYVYFCFFCSIRNTKVKKQDAKANHVEWRRSRP